MRLRRVEGRGYLTSGVRTQVQLCQNNAGADTDTSTPLEMCRSDLGLLRRVSDTGGHSFHDLDHALFNLLKSRSFLALVSQTIRLF